MNMFRKSNLIISDHITLYADSGYQGVKEIHSNSHIPSKNTKLHKLTRQQKQENHTLSKLRIKVENIIGDIKIFRIFENKYRNRRKKLNLRFNLVCGITNLLNTGLPVLEV
jgi:CRISPR/Cas system-associated endonuclease/helicase Cas3